MRKGRIVNPSPYQELGSNRADLMYRPRKKGPLEQMSEDDDRVWALMKLIVAEWQSDPMSVQCFDLGIVREATELVARHDKR